MQDISMYSVVLKSTEASQYFDEKLLPLREKISSQLDQKGIYFGFWATNEKRHERMLFLPLDGQKFTGWASFHLTLIHYLKILPQDTKKYLELLSAKIQNQKKIILHPSKIGDYDSDFTIYLEYAPSQNLLSLRKSLISLSSAHLDEKTIRDYLSVPYIPHSTLLYDDISNKNYYLAQEIIQPLSSQILQKSFSFDTLALEKTTLSNGKIEIETINQINFH